MSIAGSLFAAINGPAWDDLRAPATAIPIRGQSGDPDVDTDGTLLFDSTTAEQVAIIFQMPHAWDTTPIKPHVHWSKTTDAAGDVEWEFRYRIFNNNSIPGAWSEWAAATSRSQTIASDQTCLVDGFGEVDMAGKRGSCLISMQIRRNPDATDDTYAADVRLWEADIHYQAYGLGSEQEFPS